MTSDIKLEKDSVVLEGKKAELNVDELWYGEHVLVHEDDSRLVVNDNKGYQGGVTIQGKLTVATKKDPTPEEPNPVWEDSDLHAGVIYGRALHLFLMGDMNVGSEIMKLRELLYMENNNLTVYSDKLSVNSIEMGKKPFATATKGPITFQIGDKDVKVELSDAVEIQGPVMVKGPGLIAEQIVTEEAVVKLVEAEDIVLFPSSKIKRPVVVSGGMAQLPEEPSPVLEPFNLLARLAQLQQQINDLTEQVKVLEGKCP